MHPARGSGLRDRAIGPVERTAFEERPFQRIVDVRIARIIAGLDKDDPRPRLREACRDYTPGRTTAQHEDVDALRARDHIGPLRRGEAGHIKTPRVSRKIARLGLERNERIAEERSTSQPATDFDDNPESRFEVAASLGFWQGE